MLKKTSTFNRDELIAYVEDQVSDALRSGIVDPATGLECFLYALKPELTVALRRLSSLDPVALRQALETFGGFNQPGSVSASERSSTH